MSTKRTNQQLRRIIAVMVVIGTLVVANVLFTMITHLHIWSREDVLNQPIATSIVDTTIDGVRGTIYDRNHIVIAQEQQAFTMIAILDENAKDENNKPFYVADKDVDEVVSKIARIIPDINKKTLRKTLKNAIAQGKAQTELGTGTKRLSGDVKTKIEELNIPGISFLETTNRYYPSTPFASNLIGFAAYDEEEGDITGKLGLEQTLNDYLTGTDGRIQYQRTLEGKVLPGTTRIYSEAVNGNDVILTIDSNLQKTVEEMMEYSWVTNGAKVAWCLVMDPETGKILAWCSYPSFNQNEHKEIPNYTDRISEVAYEPGSVIKSLTYATAMDTGVFPVNTYFRAGEFNYTYDAATQTIKRMPSDITTGYPIIADALETDYGTITFEDGLAHSSNVGICELLSKYVNYNDFQKYMDAFGFFKEVGTPFVNETAGTKNMGLPMDYMSSGFGQASSVTVLQLCQAYSALFNDGNMMMPYVVDSIIDSETGEVLKKYEPTVAGTPISKDTAEKMKPLLRHVLDPYMSGDRFAIEGVDILAKTGTGELYNEETGTYDMVNFTSSIMAAAPGDDPKVMVYWGMVSSNYVAYSSYPFQQILLAALETVGSSGADSQTETPAEIEDGWESYTMPSLVNHSVNYANQQMEGWKTTNIIIGDGTSIVDQYPLAATTVNSNDRVFLLTDGATIVMPDMIGMTRKDLTAFWRMTGISVEISGYGVVVEQNIEPGEVIDSGTQISVVMN